MSTAIMSKRKIEENNVNRVITVFSHPKSQYILGIACTKDIPVDKDFFDEYCSDWIFATFNSRVRALFETNLLVVDELKGNKPKCNKKLINKLLSFLDEYCLNNGLEKGTLYADYQLVKSQYKKK